MKNATAVVAIACLTMFVAWGCGDGSDNEPAQTGPVENEPADAAFSMITPYVNESDMGPIREAYSSTDAAPWRLAHHAIDFFLAGREAMFQAVCSGTVTRVEVFTNDITGNLQIGISLTYNSHIHVTYGFEPRTPNVSDCNVQLANIRVTVGQHVSPGDLIGNLLQRGEGTHVDFGVFINDQLVCPEPYFTPEARESVLRLLHRAHPGANMCY